MSYYGITGQPITTGNTYISNRKKWSHPQAMIWSRDPGTIDSIRCYDWCC